MGTWGRVLMEGGIGIGEVGVEGLPKAEIQEGWFKLLLVSTKALRKLPGMLGIHVRDKSDRKPAWRILALVSVWKILERLLAKKEKARSQRERERERVRERKGKSKSGTVRERERERERERDPQ